MTYQIYGEHNDGNYEDDGYWKFMGPPFYDSSRPGSVEPEFDTALCSLSRDVEDMIYEDPVERDMNFSSLYEAYDEEWPL